LAPADFWLSPKLKSVLKAERFSDVEDIKSSVKKIYRLCGLLVSVPGYRSRDPGSIPGATKFSEK
jgi:hypothetical protein